MGYGMVWIASSLVWTIHVEELWRVPIVALQSDIASNSVKTHRIAECLVNSFGGQATRPLDRVDSQRHCIISESRASSSRGKAIVDKPAPQKKV